MSRSLSSWLRWLALLACVALAAVPAALMYAKRYGPPPPWPEGEITYFNASGWHDTLGAAVEQWNRLDFGVRFVETSDRSSADVVIVDKHRIRCDDCIGQVNALGHKMERSRVYLFPPRGGSEREGLVNDFYVTTIIHELGHVLGLHHVDTSCAAMHSGARDCPFGPNQIANPALINCGPHPVDLEQLAELYQLPRPPEAHPFCVEAHPHTPNRPPWGMIRRNNEAFAEGE